MTTDKKNNNHVLIIGGSSGIGNKLAVKLSIQGVVSVLARRSDRLRDLESKSENIYSYSSDVTSYEALFESIKNCVQNHGKNNKLIYCAGKQIIKPHRLLNEDDITSLIEVNLKGALYASKIFLSSKISEKNAVFCAISSIASIKPEPGIVAYSAMKASLDALIKGLARESAPRRFVGVAPGWLDTEMTQNQIVYNESFKSDLKNKSPLGLTELSDIIDAIEYIISDKAASVTGQILTIDSGSSL
jgi:gluconate 5-dehydrogenase